MPPKSSAWSLIFALLVPETDSPLLIEESSPNCTFPLAETPKLLRPGTLTDTDGSRTKTVPEAEGFNVI